MPEEELYDLELDPFEVKNLARSPEHAEVRERLRAALERWTEATNDQGKELEPPELAARKGVTRPEDARAAIKAGAGAIQVSNHGGRALDGTPASITVLPSIADEVKGEVPLILDSGIRRGTDVVKSLALGANAVAIGRPIMFGLALGGASGVDSVIKYFHTETVDTVLHCGVDSIKALGRAQVRHV